MQRITRIAFDSNDPDTIPQLEQYHSLLLLLKPHLTERTFSILATPKLIDNQQYVGWYTDLEGQPLLLDNIVNQSQKDEIIQTLQTRLNDIETAINLMPLSNEEQNLVSMWLPKIKSSSNLIYVINDEPVIVNTFQEDIQPVPIVAPTPFWRWWHFLLLALFLVGLLGLLWYLFCPLAKPKIVPAEPESKPVISAPVEEKQPEPAPVPETKPQQPEPPVVSEPIAKSEPVLTPTPEPAPVPKVKNPPNCITKEEIKKDSNPSKMVMIFDNSLSMTVTLNEPPHEVEKYFQYMSYGYGRNMSEQDRINYEKRMTRLPTRLSSSKNVATSSIDKIQQNIDISLVTLTSCPAADASPFYNYTNRGTLKRKIKRLTPTAAGGGGTPLYSGLQKASQMLDGIKRDDYILIISDGEDNCSRNNICTLANYIASQKPRLKINIVDIAGEHKIDCIANATGGKVYIAQSPKDMIKQMNKAVSSLKINRPTCQ